MKTTNFGNKIVYIKNYSENSSPKIKIPLSQTSTAFHKRNQSTIAKPRQSLQIEEYDHQIDGRFVQELLEPYFEDLYKDLTLRCLIPSAIRGRKLDRIAFMEYCNLPGIINQRLHKMLDPETTEIIECSVFVKTLSKIFASDLDTRMRFTFNIYDFNNDGLISREDIRLVLSYMPFSRRLPKVNQSAPIKKQSTLSGFHKKLSNNINFDIEDQVRISLIKEGQYTLEEGKSLDFQDREQDQEEINNLLNRVFDGKRKHLSYEEYNQFNIENSSEMFITLMQLFHDRLPCSHNCFRLKKLFRTRILGVHHNSFSSSATIQNRTSPRSPIKLIASPSTMTTCFNMVQCSSDKSERENFNSSVTKKVDNISQNQQFNMPQAKQRKSSNGTNNVTPRTGGTTQMTCSNSSSQDEEIQPFEPIGSPPRKSIIKVSGFQQALRKTQIKDFETTSLFVQTGQDIPDIDHAVSDSYKQKSPIKQASTFSFMHQRLTSQNSSPQQQFKVQNNLAKIQEDRLTLPYVTMSPPQSRLGPKQMPLHRRGQSTTISQNGSSQSFQIEPSQKPSVIDDFCSIERQQGNGYRGECYLKTKADRYKRHIVTIEGHEIFWYKEDSDLMHIIMHNLVRTYAKALPDEIIPDLNNQRMWPVKIILPPNKSRLIYFGTLAEQIACLNALNLANGSSDFYSFYRLDYVLGKGQFGKVKLAHHISSGLKTAVKLIKKREMKPIEVYQQRKEIEVLKMSQHPNIVKLVDIFESVDHYYIVLEYMDGKDMFDYLKLRHFKISESRARELIFQVINAVKYLHSYGIIHRDLKLENIMMTDSSDSAAPKLVDFGLTRILAPQERSEEPFGTLGYVAPEVLNKFPYSFSCDLWSVGCITYALLSGSLPFDHQSQQETIRQTLNQPLIFDLPIWNSVSELAKDFITGLLKKDPRERTTLEGALSHPWITTK